MKLTIKELRCPTGNVINEASIELADDAPHGRVWNAEVVFDYQPAEPRTYDNPGCPESIEVEVFELVCSPDGHHIDVTDIVDPEILWQIGEAILQHGKGLAEGAEEEVAAQLLEEARLAREVFGGAL